MKEKVSKLLRTGFLHIFGSNVINKIVTFCSSFILVRVIPKYDYGVYNYVYNLVSILMLFSGLGTLAGMLQYGSECDGEEKNAFFAFGFKVGIVSDIFIAVILSVIACISELKFPEANILLLILAWLPLTMYVKEVNLTYIRTCLLNKEYSFLNTFCTIMLLITSVSGAYFFASIGLSIGQYLAYFFTCIISIIMVSDIKGAYCCNKKLKKQQKINFIKYSLVMTLNNAISQLLYLLDTFLIGVIVANANVIASYKTATLIPFGLNFIPSAVVTYIYPYFAKNSSDLSWIKKRYKEMLLGLAAFNFLITGFCLAFAPWIVKLLFGEQYLDCVNIFRILSIGYFFAGTFRIPGGNVLVMIKRVKFNFLVCVLSGVLNIILDIILIVKYQSMGAAIATLAVFVITAIMNNIYLLYLFKKDGTKKIKNREE